VIKPHQGDGLMHKCNQHTPCEAIVLSCMLLQLRSSWT